MEIIETLFNKVTDFLKSKIGVFVALGLAGAGFILSFFGYIAFLGVAFGALGLVFAAYLRNAGTKNPFTSLAVTLGLLAVFIGTLVAGFSGDSPRSIFKKSTVYASSNKYYEDREILGAKLGKEIEEYNGDNKLKESLKKKVEKKVRKIVGEDEDEKSSSSSYDW